MNYSDCFNGLCRIVWGVMLLSVSESGVSRAHGGRAAELYAACYDTCERLSAAEARTQGRLADLIEWKEAELERLQEEKEALVLETEQWAADFEKRESQFSDDVDVAKLRLLIQQWKAVTMQKQMDGLTQRIQRAKEELAVLRKLDEASAVKSGEIEKLQSQVQMSQEVTTQQIQKKTLVLERLQAEKAQLEKENAEQAVHFKQSQDELTAELNTSKQDASQKQALLEAQQAQDAERQKRIAELEGQINQTKSELTASAAKVKELEAKAAEAAQLRTQVGEVRKQIEVVYTTHVGKDAVRSYVDKLISYYQSVPGLTSVMRNAIVSEFQAMKSKLGI